MYSKMIFSMALTPFLLSAAAPIKAKEEKKETECRSPFHVMHVDVRHTESKGLGYKDGYTTLEGFGIYDCNPNFMPFLDLRGHVFNDGKLAGNVGIGERTVISSINHIFGLYLYYDVRQEEHDLTVNQLSPGIELLGKRMEYRINGYFPVGEDESDSYQHKFHKFDENRMIVQHKKRYAMTGADGEVGVHITQSTRHDFYAGLGPYYFTADPNSFWGGKARLFWRYKDYVSLEASYSYDHVFKNIVQGTVAFSYPFGPKLRRKDSNCPNPNDLALSRAAFAPYRFEIPVVEIKKHRNAAKNPQTHQPITFWFVDNTSHSAGTIESPFPTLVQAQNASGQNDVIYVFPGDGTSTGMSAGITLKDGQALLGSGMVQHIRTTEGKIRVPAQSATAPSINNLGGSCVTLANGNEVAGFFMSLANNGVLGASPTINGMNIHNNVINTSVLGIGANAAGHLRVADNVITVSTAPGITSGVAISVLDGQFAKIKITDNQISGAGFGILLQPVVASGTAMSNTTITGNTITGFLFSGISIPFGMLNSTFNISQNLFQDTISTGGAMQGSIALLTLSSGLTNAGSYFIDNNTFVTTTTTGSVNTILASTGFPTSARLSITNNKITTGSGPGQIGVNINAGGLGTLCTTLTNNQIQLLGTNLTHSISLTAPVGIINVDDFSNNIAPLVTTSGNVNFVAPHTCGQ